MIQPSLYKDATIVDLFRNQVQENPRSIAIVSGSQKYTYLELDKLVNVIANRLITAHNLQRADRIAFSFSQKPIKIISTILAILKIGAIYTPIDPTNTPDRVQYLINQVQPALIITDEENSILFSEYNIEVLVLDDESLKDNNSSTDPMRRVSADDSAYIIFTSGSTGNPKGVQIKHKNLYAAYKAWESVYGLKQISCHLQVVGYAFDVFSGDWIRSLCSGARLVMCSEEDSSDPEILHQTISDEKVECAEFLPISLRKLASYCKTNNLKLASFKVLICGSDQWYVDEYFLFKELLSPDARMLNSYGTSETTIDTTYFEFDANNMFLADTLRRVPIGKPFPGMKIYIADEQQKLCDTGVIGEIYIGGTGVSQGYINAPQLNKDKFLTANKLDVQPVYKTGDFGRILPTGDIELIGRYDRQIKHKGRRIDLSELEHHIMRCDYIQDCAATVNGTANNQKVICFVTLKEGLSEISPTELQDIIALQLPAHMLPDSFQILKKMPTNTNGKLDRKALTKNKKRSIAIIGFGAGGLSTFVQIVDRLIQDTEQATIHIFDNGQFGLGLAYGTKSQYHILNLDTHAMAITHKKPDHFHNWFIHHSEEWGKEYPLTSTDDPFPPRGIFGLYLDHTYNTYVNLAYKNGIKVIEHRENVKDVEKLKNDILLHTRKQKIIVDDVIFALGNMPSDKFGDLERYPGYYHNASVLNDKQPPKGPIGIIGTRLTAIDTALELALEKAKSEKITLFSRTGKLPKIIGPASHYNLHFLTPEGIDNLRQSDGFVPLDDLVQLFKQELERSVGKAIQWTDLVPDGPITLQDLRSEIAFVKSGIERPWQAVLLAFYEYVPRTWNLLSVSDKKRFLKYYHSLWLTYLAAFPLKNAERLARLWRKNSIEIIGGLKKITYHQKKKVFIVETRNGNYTMESIINATGAGHSPYSQSALLAKLLDRGISAPGPLGDVHISLDNCRMISPEGRQIQHFYAIGETTFGDWFATSDLGQISRQASLVVAAIFDEKT